MDYRFAPQPADNFVLKTADRLIVVCSLSARQSLGRPLRAHCPTGSGGNGTMSVSTGNENCCSTIGLLPQSVLFQGACQYDLLHSRFDSGCGLKDVCQLATVRRIDSIV